MAFGGSYNPYGGYNSGFGGFGGSGGGFGALPGFGTPGGGFGGPFGGGVGGANTAGLNGAIYQNELNQFQDQLAKEQLQLDIDSLKRQTVRARQNRAFDELLQGTQDLLTKGKNIVNNVGQAAGS